VETVGRMVRDGWSVQGRRALIGAPGHEGEVVIT
jgi:hypothetical protein